MKMKTRRGTDIESTSYLGLLIELKGKLSVDGPRSDVAISEDGETVIHASLYDGIDYIYRNGRVLVKGRQLCREQVIKDVELWQRRCVASE